MEEKYTNIKERILFCAKNQGVSIEKFLESIGMTYGSFKGKAKKGSLNSDAIAEIYTIYPNISLEWLLTGNGEMKKNEKTTKVDERDRYIIELQKSKIETLEKEVAQLKKELEHPFGYQRVAEPDQ